MEAQRGSSFPIRESILFLFLVHQLMLFFVWIWRSKNFPFFIQSKKFPIMKPNLICIL